MKIVNFRIRKLRTSNNPEFRLRTQEFGQNYIFSKFVLQERCSFFFVASFVLWNCLPFLKSHFSFLLFFLLSATSIFCSSPFHFLPSLFSSFHLCSVWICFIVLKKLVIVKWCKIVYMLSVGSCVWGWKNWGHGGWDVR